MKATHLSQTNSSSKPTTRSSWDEIANLYDQEQLDSCSMEMKKDLNETISDSGEEDNEVKGEFIPCPKSQQSKDSNQTTERGRWTEVEHLRFLEGLVLYINDWKMIHKHIGTRSSTQARSHAQKFFIKIRRAIPEPNDLISTQKTIYQIFYKQLRNSFYMKKLNSSLEKITNLILSEENSFQKKINDSMKIKIPLIDWKTKAVKACKVNEDNINKQLLTSDKMSLSFCNDLNMNIPIDQLLSQKNKKIFNIEKAIRKNSIANSNECFNQKNKKIIPSNQACCLNPNELIDLNNQTNTNMKLSNDSWCEFNYKLNQDNKEEYNPECNCNPFHLVFEGVLNGVEAANEFDNGDIAFPSFDSLN